MVSRVRKEDIKELIERSHRSHRKREVHVLHSVDKVGTRCMLNCIQPDSYVRPHFHARQNGSEIWIPLQGKVGAIIFDFEGNIQQTYRLSLEDDRFLEIPQNTVHTLVSLKRDSIIYEFSEGPYDPKEYKTFVSWAPSDDDTERARKYLEECRAPF